MRSVATAVSPTGEPSGLTPVQRAVLNALVVSMTGITVEATAGDRLYRKETLIEPKVAEGAPHLHLRNGILEVRLAKQQ